MGWYWPASPRILAELLVLAYALVSVGAVSRTIALVFDCDDTLAPDTTTWLLQQFGVDTDAFWQRAGDLVRAGWDPPLAYLDLIRMEADAGNLKGLTRERLAELGPKVEFYPGVPEVFDALRDFVMAEKRFRHYGINLHYYVISSGIEDLLVHTRIAPYLHDLWGCRLAYDDQGRIRGPRAVITFTEKTRYLFCINKGIVGAVQRENPYLVNASIDQEARPIPFSNIVYLGDGPSDVPSMRVVDLFKGFTIGVTCEKNAKRAYELSLGRRARMTAEADFSEGKLLRTYLQEHIKRTATRICDDIERFLVRGPEI